MKLLLEDKIGLYASSSYLHKHGTPKYCTDLASHLLINYSFQNQFQEEEKWHYLDNGLSSKFTFQPIFNSNDMESCLNACISGLGIGRFTELTARNALHEKLIHPILEQYDWGTYHLFAIYPQQQSLPERTRLFLDFIFSHTKTLLSDTHSLTKTIPLAR